MSVLGGNSDDLVVSIPSRLGTVVAFYCNKCILIDKKRTKSSSNVYVLQTEMIMTDEDDNAIDENS